MSVPTILLALHVAGGGTALVSGLVPMLARKGGRLHRRAGLVFSTAMTGSALAALVLAVLVGSDLLLTIAVLTLFLIASGLRAAAFRRGARPGPLDGAACLLLAVFGLWLAGHDAPDPTRLFFGLGSLVLAVRQWRLGRASDPDWLLAHIAGLGGAYLATVTAFVVVNFPDLPKPVTFIGPTLAGTALITRASLRHARASAHRRRHPPAAPHPA